MSTKPHPVEDYFSAVSLILSSGTGVPETSYYPALSALLNEIGGKLDKPRVTTVINPANHDLTAKDGLGPAGTRPRSF